MENMKNLMGKNSLKQMFGKLETKNFALSFDGKIAIFSENESSYQTWDKEKQTLTDVNDFVIDVPFFFKMPVQKVSVGDLILINDVPHYVIENKGAVGISVLNVETGNVVQKVKKSNLLNFNFYVKVVSLFENSLDGKSENQMQNMLPLLMLGGSENSGENSGMEMFLMMQMMNGQNSENQMQNMFPFLLMGKSENNSMMETMLMMQMMGGNNIFAPKVETKEEKSK